MKKTQVSNLTLAIPPKRPFPKVTPAMSKAGEQMEAELKQAGYYASMGGVYQLKRYKKAHRDIIGAYLERDLTSLEAIYMAMRLASKKEKI
jgi:hypothetical protein